jgi:SulP family sulfate permease
LQKPSEAPLDTRPRPLWSRERFRSHARASGGARRLEILPLARYLKGYTKKDLRADARAGMNVALLDFPLGMAYALVAGLPIQYGIYASALAAMIGPLFASSRFLMLGPSNAIAVLTMSALMGLRLEPGQTVVVMPLLLLMVGALLVAGAFFGVARLINYVSRSVVTGFITAAAFLIIGNQLRNVMGISIPKAGTFFGVLQGTFLNIGAIQWPSVALAAGAAGLYFAVRKYLRFLPAVAVVLVVAAVANAGLGQWIDGWGGRVSTLQSLPSGQWPLTVPEFDSEMVRRLLPVAFAIAFLSVLESSSIAKTLAARAGDRLNVDQQLLSMGIANLGCAFGSGMPISGSLTRSALNYSSGTRTPVASMVSGALVATGALTLGRWIGWIPKPALAALVISIGSSLIQPRSIRFVLGSTNGDALVFLATFIAGLLLPLDTAIYIGTGVSIVFFLRKAAIPELQEYNFTKEGELAEISKKEERPRPHIAILHVEGDLFFGASEIFMDQMRRAAEDPAIRIFILRLKNAHHLDATCALAIEEFIRYLRTEERDLIVSGAREEIYRVFRDSGLLKVLGAENFFLDTPGNPNLSTRNALKRSQEILGDEQANIVLLVNKKREKGGGV